MKFLTLLFPILTVLLLLCFALTLPDLRRCILPCGEPPAARGRKGRRASAPGLPAADRSRALGRRDLLPVLAITLVYALTAFFRLGDTAAPQSFVPMEGRSVEFLLPEGGFPSRILLYPGVGQGEYELSYSEDGESYAAVDTFTQNHVAVLKWAALSPSAELSPRFVRLRCTSGDPWLGEILFLDGDGRPMAVETGEPLLCDEPETAPETPGFLNSSYFDEIYHARTAWEHIRGLWPYEITHPPLGKQLIGLGIRLFGMTPFGWRFTGTLFGVLMLPLLYVFLKKLFGGRLVPSLGTLLFATDFMHYVQTRIATIDTYAVFFILLMYLFLYLWLTEDKLWALGAAGLAFGLGAASKWTCLYAGAGMGVLWLAKWLVRLVRAGRDPSKSGEVWRRFWGNVGFCLIFFVLLPCGIYSLSYLPYGRARGVGPFTAEYLRMVLENQQYMFTYHSKSVLGATHPYSSHWYQWLLDLRPILYVLEYPDAATKISIAAFVNPVLCWGGLLSLPLLGYMAAARRDRRAAFLLAGYLAQLLPWVGITRLTFAYHYFPSTLFLVLALSYVLALLRENRRDWKLPALALTAGSVLLFALFFPALNGLPIGRDLGTALMKWLPGWPL